MICALVNLGRKKAAADPEFRAKEVLAVLENKRSTAESAEDAEKN